MVWLQNQIHCNSEYEIIHWQRKSCRFIMYEILHYPIILTSKAKLIKVASFEFFSIWLSLLVSKSWVIRSLLSSVRLSAFIPGSPHYLYYEDLLNKCNVNIDTQEGHSGFVFIRKEWLVAIVAFVFVCLFFVSLWPKGLKIIKRNVINKGKYA